MQIPDIDGSYTKVFGSDRPDEKAFYFNDITYGGFNEFRRWIIIIRQIPEQPQKSEVILKTRMSIFKTPSFPKEKFQELSKACF